MRRHPRRTTVEARQTNCRHRAQRPTSPGESHVRVRAPEDHAGRTDPPRRRRAACPGSTSRRPGRPRFGTQGAREDGECGQRPAAVRARRVRAEGPCRSSFPDPSCQTRMRCSASWRPGQSVPCSSAAQMNSPRSPTRSHAPPRRAPAWTAAPAENRRRCSSAARRASARPVWSRSSSRWRPAEGPSSPWAAAWRSARTVCRTPRSPRPARPASHAPRGDGRGLRRAGERAGPAPSRTGRTGAGLGRRARHRPALRAHRPTAGAHLGGARGRPGPGGPALVRRLHPAPPRLPVPHAAHRPPRRGRHLPGRRHPPPPPAAPAPGRNGPAAHRPPHRARPFQPGRGTPTAHRHPRRYPGTRPGGRDIRALRRQRLLRRGARLQPGVR